MNRSLEELYEIKFKIEDRLEEKGYFTTGITKSYYKGMIELLTIGTLKIRKKSMSFNINKKISTLTILMEKEDISAPTLSVSMKTFREILTKIVGCNIDYSIRFDCMIDNKMSNLNIDELISKTIEDREPSYIIMIVQFITRVVTQYKSEYSVNDIEEYLWILGAIILKEYSQIKNAPLTEVILGNILAVNESIKRIK